MIRRVNAFVTVIHCGVDCSINRSMLGRIYPKHPGARTRSDDVVHRILCCSVVLVHLSGDGMRPLKLVLFPLRGI